MHDKLFTLEIGIRHYYSDVKPATIYSLFKRAMFAIEISLGQAASQAPVLVHAPKPSLSNCATILVTRVFLSGPPCGNKAKCDTYRYLLSNYEFIF